MAVRYEPKDHIQHVDVAPRVDGILDQRDITIQSYQTTIPFELHALDDRLDGAWLSPAIKFGVFSRTRQTGVESCSVVLGLQDQLSIRTYDYERRRPLWFSWQDVIVDTVSIHYYRGEDGLLQFTTTGGGRRITEERLYDFNSTFLRIPKESVTKRHFDLAKLRELCFTRFVDRLYMVRFSDPSGAEYESIDHALFQSRKYINRDAPRLLEVRADTQVKIESFDSDIIVRSDELTEAIHVRFFIRGQSGTLRLRFPKLCLRNAASTPEHQAEAFYRIVDATVRSVLDADYYTHQQRSLEDLETDFGMFPDLVDLAPFREVLKDAEARKHFFLQINLAAPWGEWRPHLRAIDELLATTKVMDQVQTLLADLLTRNPRMVAKLLGECQSDAKMRRIGGVTASVIAGQMQAVPADVRGLVEETLLVWMLECEQEAWDVEPETGEIAVRNMRWRVEDVSFDWLPAVIWKILGVMHDRLMGSTTDVGPLLQKLDWCVDAARGLPSFHTKSPAALRLIAADKVPRAAAGGVTILKSPVGDIPGLDEAILAQYGLPLWPLLTLYRSIESCISE